MANRARTLLHKVLSPHNWRGLTGLMLNARNPLPVIWRFYLKRGRYPFTIGLRTPLGALQLELYSRQDLITVHEVFFRQDYRVPRDLNLIVDFGSNIGIASAYFLTRNPEIKAYAYEPVPVNVVRAKRNLARFADRLELAQCAVGTMNGRVEFGVERSGRYGGIGRTRGEIIEVECRRAEDELRRIARHHARIDALKIDVEGLEVPILESLSSDVLARISRILAECDGREVSLPAFAYDQYLSIARFRHQG